MFLDIDVVEFNDSSVPFTSILLNSAMVRQVQPIDTNVQARYIEGRERALEDQQDDPSIKVSPVEALPSQGAMIIMLSPQLGTYYTVTPYEDVKRQFMQRPQNQSLVE